MKLLSFAVGPGEGRRRHRFRFGGRRRWGRQRHRPDAAGPERNRRRRRPHLATALHATAAATTATRGLGRRR